MTSEATLALRQRVIDAISADVKGFDLRFKDKDPLHLKITRFLDRLPLPKNGLIKGFWSRWMRFNTTIYPKVWVDSSEEWDAYVRAKVAMLQHEWVHLIDGESFYGLLPRKLKYLNLVLFSTAYAAPQIFALLALLAPVAILAGAPLMHWLLLLFLLFLAPVPSPGRMLAEMRAYRRTVELGGDPEYIVQHFTGRNYWFMWPFRKHVLKMLKKPSPYKERMDAVWYADAGS